MTATTLGNAGPISTNGSSRWRGQWIAPEARPALDLLQATLGGSTARGEFSRSIFRKAFHVAEIPQAAPTRLSADSRYVLWVNGQEVGRGPARSQPMRQRFDEYDLAPYLVRGSNVIVILVTYYGQPTSFWQPAPAGSSPDAVLVFEADLGGEGAVLSDGSWRVHRSPAWTIPARTSGLHGVPVEVFDARQLAAGWRETGFDDSSWPAAAVVMATHVGGLAESRPPTYPFGRLRPRAISHLVGDRVSPARLTETSRRVSPAWTSDHPALRVTQALLQPAEGSDTAQTSGPDIVLPLTVAVDADTVQHVGVDFGRIVAGFVELDIEAPAGVVVEMYYREKKFVPELAGAGLDPETGARLVSGGGPQTFEAFEVNGLRYLHLIVHAEEKAAVTFSRVAVREYLYPRTGQAYFRCDDPRLEALYRAGIRTVQLNSLDAYIDCPTREQRSWVGDGVVHQQVDLATNADWGLARNYLDLGSRR